VGALAGAGLGWIAQPTVVYAATMGYKISEFANDWISKGFHIKIDGIELSMKPGNNGSIVFKKVFSSTPSRAAQKAIDKAYALLKDPSVRADFLNTAIKGRDYLKTFGTKAATSKSGELNFLVKALQKYGR
jgi:hypothetical protein